MSENIEIQVFEIRVQAKKKLNEDEMWLVANDFHQRLQGFSTVCPEELKGAEINLMPIIKQ